MRGKKRVTKLRLHGIPNQNTQLKVEGTSISCAGIVLRADYSLAVRIRPRYGYKSSAVNQTENHKNKIAPWFGVSDKYFLDGKFTNTNVGVTVKV
jgi:hypothetical protein